MRYIRLRDALEGLTPARRSPQKMMSRTRDSRPESMSESHVRQEQLRIRIRKWLSRAYRRST